MENKAEYKQIIDFGNDAVEAAFNIERAIEELAINIVAEYIEKNNQEDSFGLSMIDAICIELHRRDRGGEVIKQYAKLVQNNKTEME